MEHADLLNTLSENSALVEQFLHQHHHAFMETTSQFLADAAAEAAKQDDGGWWGAYLQLFKNTLNFVHSTITPPLNAIGIKQTWGPSIFLFTASK